MTPEQELRETMEWLPSTLRHNEDLAPLVAAGDRLLDPIPDKVLAKAREQERLYKDADAYWRVIRAWVIGGEQQ